MEADAPIFVAGHRGLVGSAIVRSLNAAGFTNVVTRGREELDLRNRDAVRRFFDLVKPAYVFDAAAKVGGIQANVDAPVEFMLWNLEIQNHLISAAHENGVKKFLFLGSSCIYPREAPQPIPEEALLSSPLEATNEPYALAKICGVRLCQAYSRQYGSNFISVMPTNLYGPGDNFDLTTSHVLPALIRKAHCAILEQSEEIVVWGSGSPRRELMHVDDLADACLFLMKSYDDPAHINVGTGLDASIREIAEIVCQVVGYKGRIVYDLTKPDGTPRKLLDVSKLTSLGWKARITLREGIAETYDWFLKHCLSS